MASTNNKDQEMVDSYTLCQKHPGNSQPVAVPTHRDPTVSSHHIQTPPSSTHRTARAEGKRTGSKPKKDTSQHNLDAHPQCHRATSHTAIPTPSTRTNPGRSSCTHPTPENQGQGHGSEGPGEGEKNFVTLHQRRNCPGVTSQA